MYLEVTWWPWQNPWLQGLGSDSSSLKKIFFLGIQWIWEEDLDWRVGFAIFTESKLLYSHYFFPARTNWCRWSKERVRITSGDLTRRTASHAYLNLSIELLPFRWRIPSIQVPVSSFLPSTSWELRYELAPESAIKVWYNYRIWWHCTEEEN